MAYNLQKFIDYLQEQVDNHGIYVWGGQGQHHPTITESWIRKMETSTVNANRAINFWKKQCAAGYEKKLKAFDCSGLGMYWLQNLKGLYKSDMSANTMKSKCGKISKDRLKKGDWVFRIYTSGNNKGKAYHIGYVVDEKLNVIEAMGRDDGVVKRSLNKSGKNYWNYFGRPEIFKAEIEGGGRPEPAIGDCVEVVGGSVIVRDRNSTSGTVLGIVHEGDRYELIAVAPSGWYQINYKGIRDAYISNRSDLTKLTNGTTWTVSRLLKKTNPMMRGDDVKNVQSALKSKGYGIGQSGADGIFGNDTDKAVRAFQKAKSLAVDGIVGKATTEALGGKWTG